MKNTPTAMPAYRKLAFAAGIHLALAGTCFYTYADEGGADMLILGAMTLIAAGLAWYLAILDLKAVDK